MRRDPPQSAGSRGLAALSASLARGIAGNPVDSNLVFSPLSIYTALALVAAGARGATLDEILRVLGARSRGELDEFVARAVGGALRDRTDSGGPRVAFACGVWSDLACPLKPGFLKAVVDGGYRAEASTVDFRGDPDGSRQLINAWAARATNNLIDSVLGPRSVTESTRVVLGNAVYFKGKWDQPFDERNTADAPFRRLGGALPVDVPFMQSWDEQFVVVHDGFKVLKLRYKMVDALLTSTHFSLCIFLPDADDGLRSLVDAIASRPGFLRDHLPRRKVEVGEFRVPRFKLSFHDSVVDVLKELGLSLPFSPLGDLSDMTGPDDSGFGMIVDEVVHKAVIEVNEEGTEAAAVTMVTDRFGCAARCNPPPQVDFVADHPFAYFIVEEESGAIVFAGHVVDPSRES
ncbi:putative serpin-Z8 [Triticum dicoccoides]|uniref:putative serpin-Z8 n=1 Tax=Triticum dicoccoides TaxID=85692 RepID=UPI00188F95DD|nr:putative serpin-Z8 [Triticum dicoccoides]